MVGKREFNLTCNDYRVSFPEHCFVRESLVEH